MPFEMNDKLVLLFRKNRARVQSSTNSSFGFFFARDKETGQDLIYIAPKKLKNQAPVFKSLDDLSKLITLHSRMRSGLKKGSKFCVGSVYVDQGSDELRFRLTTSKGLGPNMFEKGLKKLNTSRKLNIPAFTIEGRGGNLDRLGAIRARWSESGWTKAVRSDATPKGMVDDLENILRAFDSDLDELYALQSVSAQALAAEMERDRDLILARLTVVREEHTVQELMVSKKAELSQHDLLAVLDARRMARQSLIKLLVEKVQKTAEKAGRSIRITADGLPYGMIEAALDLATAQMMEGPIPPQITKQDLIKLIETDALTWKVEDTFISGRNQSLELARAIAEGPVYAMRQPAGSALALKEHAEQRIPGITAALKGISGDHLPMSFKSSEQLQKYADERYGGDVTRVMNIVQHNIVYESLRKLYTGLAEIRKSKEYDIAEFKDYFTKDIDGKLPQAGYRYVLLRVWKDSFYTEIRLHVRKMRELRDNHKMRSLYKSLKTISDGAVSKENAVSAQKVITLITRRNDALRKATQELFQHALRSEELPQNLLDGDINAQSGPASKIHGRREVGPKMMPYFVNISEGISKRIERWQETHDHLMATRPDTQAMVVIQPDLDASGSDGVNALLNDAPKINKVLNKKARQLAELAGGVFKAAPIKTKESALRKVENKFGGDARFLTDACRCSMVFDTIGALYKALGLIDTDKTLKIIAMKDRFCNPKDDSGYRDMNLLVMIEKGSVKMTCEIQLHLRQILEVKEVSHRFYNETRLTEVAVNEANLKKLAALAPLEGTALAAARASLDSLFKTPDKDAQIEGWMAKLILNTHNGMKVAYNNILNTALDSTQ